MTTSLTLPVKEVEQTNKQMMVLQEQATTLTVENPAQVTVAADLLTTIKNARKTVTGRKEEITRPLMSGLASIRDLFKPIELTLENAEKVVKAKMLAYNTIEQEKIEKEKARINGRVEKGTMRLDTAVEKLGSVGTVTKMKTRTLTKVRVVDEALVPREFMVPDMTKITEAVLRQGVEIPGIEKYQEKIVSV